MVSDSSNIFTLAMSGELSQFKKKYLPEDIDRLDSGSSLLHTAISGRKFDIALFLISQGINVDLRDSEGQTALHYISLYPDIPVTKALLEHGGNINIKDNYGNNAFARALFNSKGKYYDMVELFMHYHPDVTSKNRANRSPLDLAHIINDPKLINLLEAIPHAQEIDSPASTGEIMTDNMIIDLSGNTSEITKWIWDHLVPVSGQADTVQGELLRAVEKLRWEAQNNGNGNWDDRFEMFTDYLETTLCDNPACGTETKAIICADLNRLRGSEYYPYIEDDLYDRLTEQIVAFCRCHPQPIPHEKDPRQYR